MPITSWTPANVLRPIVAGFRPAAIQTKMIAQAIAPRRTGKMARSIRVNFTGLTSGFLRTGVRYVYPVVSGASPHRIEPRAKMALAGQGFGPVGGANHPGMRPNPFLTRAAAAFPALYAAQVRRRMR